MGNTCLKCAALLFNKGAASELRAGTGKTVKEVNHLFSVFVFTLTIVWQTNIMNFPADDSRKIFFIKDLFK